MKKFTSLIFAFFIFFSLSACKKPTPPTISDATAKEAILSYCPEAIITECTLNQEANTYEIEYKTSHNVYIGLVNGNNGEIISVSLKETIPADDNSIFETEEPDEENFISIDQALSIALGDSGISGTATLIKNDLDRENKKFTIVFKSGTREFTYIIDAITGDILSSETLLDS